MPSPPLRTPTPAVPDVLVSFPSQHVLLVTLNRPRQLNAVHTAQHIALAALYQWFDEEPWLRCAVLTGAGRAFCAGADLKEWHERGANADEEDRQQHPRGLEPWRASGFGGLSNRAGRKPVMAAVNGLCLGGGMEMAINADLVVAAEAARFGLPEVTRGVIAVAGGLPRLVRTVGRQRAAEMALAGRADYTAAQMERWGLVNRVVPGENVVEEALALAREIAGNSPDAVLVTREALRLGWEGFGPEMGTDLIARGLYGRIDGGDNMREGVQSFVEKRRAVWKDSKL